MHAHLIFGPDFIFCFAIAHDTTWGSICDSSSQKDGLLCFVGKYVNSDHHSLTFFLCDKLKFFFPSEISSLSHYYSIHRWNRTKMHINNLISSHNLLAKKRTSSKTIGIFQNEKYCALLIFEKC